MLCNRTLIKIDRLVDEVERLIHLEHDQQVRILSILARINDLDYQLVQIEVNLEDMER